MFYAVPPTEFAVLQVSRPASGFTGRAATVRIRTLKVQACTMPASRVSLVARRAAMSPGAFPHMVRLGL